jgi:hypothetical protein
MCQGRNAALRSWLTELKATSQKPILRILEELQDGDSWQERERHWIGLYRSRGVNLLNLTAGGNGFAVHTDESRKKIARALTGDHNPMKRPEVAAKVSAKRRGLIFSSAWRAALSRATKGRPKPLGFGANNRFPPGSHRRPGWHHTAETRAKLSASKIGKPQVHMRGDKNPSKRPDVRLKLSAARIGKRLSPETRAKISASLVGNKRALGFRHSEESRIKMSAARMGNKYSLGYRHSEATRARMSAAKIGKKLSSEIRGKISAASRGRVVSSETRTRMSAAAKRRWADLNQRIFQLPTLN